MAKPNRNRNRNRRGKARKGVQSQSSAPKPKPNPKVQPASQHAPPPVKSLTDTAPTVAEFPRGEGITAKAFVLALRYVDEHNASMVGVKYCNCPANCGCACSGACCDEPDCACDCPGEMPETMRGASMNLLAHAQIAINENISIDDALDAPLFKYKAERESLIVNTNINRMQSPPSLLELDDGVEICGVKLRYPKGRDLMYITPDGVYAELLNAVARCAGRSRAEVEAMPIDIYLHLYEWVGKDAGVSPEILY